MRKILASAAASAGAAAVVLATAAPALAVVTFDIATGHGSVGKGDVQTVFGWNNATMQKNHGGISFRATDVTEYEVTCKAEYDVTTTEQQGKKVVTKTKKVKVRETFDETAAAVYDTAKTTKSNPQGSLTGWNLTGNTLDAALSEAVPAEGDACTVDDEGTGRAGTLTDEITVTAIDEGDQLEAVHQGVAKTIWTPPAPVEPVL